MALYPRTNHALDTNPPGGVRHITTSASDWLWFCFAAMLFTWLITLVWAYTDRRRNRIFHYIPVIVLAVATVAYFSMASDLGWTLIRSQYDGHPTRQIWYVRYIQWFINAPLILLSLLAFTSMATPQILSILFFAWFYVVNGLVGALVTSSYKWGYYGFGIFALFFIWYMLLGHVSLFHFRNESYRLGYYGGALFISFMWMLYPICWGLSEGSDKISSTSEMVFYGVLDLLSGPVYLLIYMAYLGRFGVHELYPTAFGTADRGIYNEEVAQKPPQQHDQQPPAVDT